MSEVAKPIPKPQLRGLLHSAIKRNLILVGISCFASCIYMKFVFGKARKDAYANFYKSYDAEKEFETMRKKGLFDSCPVD